MATYMQKINCAVKIKELLSNPDVELIILKKLDYLKKDTNIGFGHSLSNCQINSFKEAVNSSSKKRTLGEHLLYLVHLKGIQKDSDVYNKVNIRKDYWSRLISDKINKPSKYKLLLIGISLELTLYEVIELLESVGYTFIPSNSFENAIFTVFEQEIYKINDIEEIFVDMLKLPSIFDYA